MRRFAGVGPVLAMLLLGSTGCSSNAGKIEGTKWSSLQGTVKGMRVPQGTVKLEFGKEHKLRYIVGSQTFAGTYALGMGKYVTFHFTRELAGRKSHTETIAITGAKLTLTDTDGTTLDFMKEQ